MGNVWVFVEQSKEGISDVSLELLGEGRKMADKLGCQLEAILIGSQTQNLVDEISSYKADRIFLSDDESYADYFPELYSNAICSLIEQHHPGLILLGATSTGLDLAIRLAAKAKAELINGYIDFDLDEQKVFTITMSGYNGQLYAKVQPQLDRLSVVTVRTGLLGFEKATTGYATEVIKIPLAKEALAIKRSFTVNKFIRADPELVDISEADLIVGVGAGVHGLAHYKLVEKLSHFLSASLGGTRKVRDFGWIDNSRLIGQSGKYVGPSLYIAIGISGAIHHSVGIRDSKYIISINTDKGAPIIEMSDLALIGDCNQLVPLILNKLGQIEGSNVPD